MEEKISSENVNTVEKNCDKHIEEIKVTENCILVPLRKEKANDMESQNSVQGTTANKVQDFDRQESVKKNKTRVLKRKVTEDGVTIERVLSEGEASSGFETVSSINSDLDLEDFRLSSSDDESDYNVIVRIENELAYRQSKSSDKRRYSSLDRSNGEIRSNSKSEQFLCNYSGPRNGIIRSYKQSLHWKRLYNSAFQGYDWSHSWSRADEDSRYSRRTSCDREWSRFSDNSVRSRQSRCIDQSKRYRGSLYTADNMGKSKKTAIDWQNFEFKYEFIGSKSSSNKIIKGESKHSKSFNQLKSSEKRIMQSTKQAISSSKPSSMSIWKRLDGGGPHKKLKKDPDRSSGSPSTCQPRKKEQTPFLVELERKLNKAKQVQQTQTKQLKQQTSAKMNDVADSEQNKTQNCVSETTTGAATATTAPMSEAAVGSLNPNYEQTSRYAFPSNNLHMYSNLYGSFPSVSLENLPLVPGPTGLPVHITPTGQQIFHDMDGRRIPIGHNGHYLPLDPTGRLFAHIVSPGNQAVPVHLTEDGVLRLPNSEPVPYGPSHNLPVNIDGSIIYIGPDSRPLGHFPNLPRQPALQLLQMTQFNTFGNGQGENQEGTSVAPQISYQTRQEQTPEINRGFEGQYSDSSSLQASTASPMPESTPSLMPESATSTNPSSSVQSLRSFLLNSTSNSCGETNKADVLMNYQRRARERREDAFKCNEIEKNLGVTPSKGGVKRSTPLKLSLKKTSKDENDGGCDSTDSSDSESASGLKSSSGAKKDEKKPVESNTEDFIVRKIRKVLKSLDDNKFKPPALGRFIISEVSVDDIGEASPNESPLLKNRAKLSFITPNASNSHSRRESETAEKPAVVYSFLSREKSSDRPKKAGKFNEVYKNFGSVKLPVFTFDSAVQCDLTSKEINKLNTKIAEMEKEVVRLRNVNANLLDGFRNIQEANVKKSEELDKALSDIDKRNGEILTLKRLLNEKRRG